MNKFTSSCMYPCHIYLYGSNILSHKSFIAVLCLRNNAYGKLYQYMDKQVHIASIF